MTPREMTLTVRGWAVRAFQWLLAPVTEDWHGLSLTRFIAAFCCLLVWHDVVLHERTLTYVHLWVLVAAIATAFGKKVFGAFLQRIGLRSASQDTRIDARIDIAERRKQGEMWGCEAT